MAWVYSYPSGAANITGGTVSGWFDYYTYRSMKGPVEMRLTDVTFDSGYAFQTFWTNMQLVNGGGYVYRSFTLTKNWGVTPGWMSLANYQSVTSLRLRITSSSDVPNNGAGAWFKFNAVIRWDPQA